MEQNTCNVCNKAIDPEGESYDLMISVTRYQDGEAVKSMIEPDHDKIGADYYVVGLQCCGHLVENVWNGLLVVTGG